MDLAGPADTSLLLDGQDVPPVHEDNTAGRSPFLLTSDHYGRAIPRALGDLGLPASKFERHMAWDVGIAGVANALSKHLDAHLIAQRYSRLVIDCNRPPAAASSIPRISEATTIPGNEDDLASGGRGAADGDLRSLSPPHRRGDRAPAARPCSDRAGVAAQLHAGLCRRRAALAYRHAVSARHAIAAAVAETSCAPRPITWSATTSPTR